MNVNYKSEDIPKDIIKKNDIYKYNHYTKFIKGNFNYNVIRKFVKEIDLELVKPQRAGVIPTTIHNNQLYFGLGIDTNSGELTDFGGGISYKDHKDKNVIYGALREYQEETLGIFGPINYEDTMDNVAIYNHNNLIIFIMIIINIDKSHELFEHEYQLLHNNNILPEVCGIKWVTVNEFKEIVAKRGKMFHRVQTFLQQAGDFYKFL